MVSLFGKNHRHCLVIKFGNVECCLAIIWRKHNQKREVGIDDYGGNEINFAYRRVVNVKICRGVRTEHT